MGWIKDVYDVITDLISRAAEKKRAQTKQKHAEKKAKLNEKSSPEITRANKGLPPKRRNWVMDWKRW